MATGDARAPRVPPGWFVRIAWRAHRLLYRVSGGRFLWTPPNKRGWGALVLTTTGRRSGQEREAIVAYLEDRPALVLIAMHGWQPGHPARWLNLRAHPEARVKLPRGESRRVRARQATGDERDRLWARWTAVNSGFDLNAAAAARPTPTPVIVLDPSSPLPRA